MRGTVVTLAALALLPAMAESAEPAPLEEEFLEYLSQFEGDEDNWTLFADDEADDDKDEKPATAAAKPVKEVKK